MHQHRFFVKYWSKSKLDKLRSDAGIPATPPFQRGWGGFKSLCKLNSEQVILTKSS